MSRIFIDTHAHLDGEEFRQDIEDVVDRARKAGVSKAFIPAIDLKSIDSVYAVCRRFPHFAYPMIGLHPEEVRADRHEVLAEMKRILAISMATDSDASNETCSFTEKTKQKYAPSPIAIGEIGLDYYWSREFENEQLEAFEEQIKWAVEYRLPLMIHCRKAQNEMVKVLRKYEKDLTGGVFHCFTGNEKEAEELLSFHKFALGIGGVFTFKSSHMRETLPKNVSLDRIVLETDSPYMAPIPHRGERNESAFVVEVLKQIAQSYGVSEEEVACRTNANVKRIFHIDA
ncbi:TatD family hydrolase [Hoylesella oralis]|uniref:TatD family hydrolase n=1 Tax=Hoylesella oralis TaxID=28134 RepID=UPI00360D0268